MKTKSIIKYAAIIILSVLVGIDIAYTINHEPIIILEEHEMRLVGDPTNPRISYEGQPSDRTLLPYVPNHQVPFDYEGRIDYDALIKKIMPGLWKDKLAAIGVDVHPFHMVSLRGFQNGIYTEQSYQCGYVIDHDDQVYYMEGRIDKSHSFDVEVFTENPMSCTPNHGSCFCNAQTLAEEQLMDFDYTPFNLVEETIVANYIKEHLKDNTNLNMYDYKIGKYNMDYNDVNILSFCGQFDGKLNNPYFGGSVNSFTHDNGFHLSSDLSPLCVIEDDVKWYSFD